MSSIFGIMMVSGHLNDQFKMAKELKAIHYLLKNKRIFQSKKAITVYITFLKNMPKDANSQFLIHI